MNDIENYLNIIFENTIFKIIISNKISKDYKYKKIIIENKIQNYYVSKYTDKQTFNELINKEDIIKYIIDTTNYFKQINVFSENYNYEIKISKKNKILFNKTSNNTNYKINTMVNNKKNYILEEGNIIKPLIDMGIFTSEGKVINSKYDKYRQINKFIEIIDNELKDKDIKNLNVIDFGCGKSYLTFVLYYYFTEIKHINVNMIGLDLKKEVIENCNKAAKKYNYNNLKFEVGDINGYNCPFDVDIVVTLHACDKATDYALYNAIKWNTKMIFSVPCCQHEIFKTSNYSANILNRYSIAKERISALYTDIIRCNLLEVMGYKTDLLEFIDLEGTPKNLLVRAVKSNIPKNIKEQFLKEVEEILALSNAKQTLYELLKKDIYK